MSNKRSKPYNFGIDQLFTQIKVNPKQSYEKTQAHTKKDQHQINTKVRLLSIILGNIYIKNLLQAFTIIKTKPFRKTYIRQNLVSVLIRIFQKQQQNKKSEGFYSLRRYFIEVKNAQAKKFQIIVRKGKLSASKFFFICLTEKYKNHLIQGFGRIKYASQQGYVDRRQRYRKGFRIWMKIWIQIVKRHFFQLKSSRFMIERKRALKKLQKTVTEQKQRSLYLGLERLKRNLYMARQKAITKDIEEIEKRLQKKQDQQLKELKQKKQKLEKNLADIKKEKQEISHSYQIQIKEAQAKNIQIQQNIKSLRKQNQSLTSQIAKINQKLKENYSIDQVFQMFYNNFLLYLIKHKNSPLLKSQMLEALTKPLVPVQIPIQSLKEENRTLKELLAQYVLIYGEKSLEQVALEIPYEYLVKENQVMYKVLMTLLPRLNNDRNQLNEVKQTLDSVEKILKQLKI